MTAMMADLQAACDDVGERADCLRHLLTDAALPSIIAARLLVQLDGMRAELARAIQTAEGATAACKGDHG